MRGEREVQGGFPGRNGVLSLKFIHSTVFTEQPLLYVENQAHRE